MHLSTHPCVSINKGATEIHLSRVRPGDFPAGPVVKSPSAVQETQETWVRSLDREDTLEEERATHSSILAWKIP